MDHVDRGDNGHAGAGGVFLKIPSQINRALARIKGPGLFEPNHGSPNHDFGVYSDRTIRPRCCCCQCLPPLWTRPVQPAGSLAQTNATLRVIPLISYLVILLVRLPRFLHRLPDEIQDKVKKVWEGYQEGEECYEEQKKTR